MPRCISPLTLRRSGGHFDVVPCGKCNFCLQKRRADWTFRLQQEAKLAKTQMFLTLTYDENQVPKNPLSDLPELRLSDLQKFIKVIRKACAEHSDIPIRHYSVGEYGTKTCRPHYHSIMFNVPDDMQVKLHSMWKHGLIHIGNVSAASIQYVTKYVINRNQDYIGRSKPFAAMSKKPGIGANYVTTHKVWHNEGYKNYTQVNGVKSGLPRYYKDKIFSPFDKEHISRLATYQSVNDYRQSIVDLSKFHADPTAYYDERIANEHELINKRLNEKNTF